MSGDDEYELRRQLRAAQERAAEDGRLRDAALERAAEERRLRDAALERAAEYRRLRDAAQERAAEYRRLRDAAQERAAEERRLRDAAQERALEARRQREAAQEHVLEVRRHALEVRHQREAAKVHTLEVLRQREAAEERIRAAEALSKFAHHLRRCHLLDSKLRVAYNGPSTDSRTQARYAADRVCPLQIVPWKDFPTEMLAVLDELSLSNNFTESFSAVIPTEAGFQSATPVRGQSDLRNRAQFVVTDAVDTMLEKVCEDPTLRETFGIVSDVKVFFGNSRVGQCCYYHIPGVGVDPVLHVLYEAPHRLTPGQLETGLDGKHVIELSHVMDKSHQTGDVFVSESRRLAAAVIAQLYATMIQERVRFGYIDTGEVKVFLRIGEDPSRVEYYLTIPSRDVDLERDAEPRLHLTSVAQVFAFTLLALQSPGLDKDSVDAILALETQDVACEVVLAEISEMDRQKPCHKACAPKKENEFYRRSPLSIQTEDLQIMDDHPYCTHECLRGLTFGGSLDEKCPNAKDHGTEHIDREEFLRLVGEQLEFPRINAEFLPLNASGSVGSLFKIRLSSHGYTLVAKAFDRYDGDLACYEEHMYSLLRDLQGYYIPVCPGQVVLRRAMYCAHYEWSRSEHFLLLSYAGRPVLHALSKVEEAITNQILTALAQLHKYRVLHHDAEPRNILYDERTGKCMIVDLERSQSRDREALGRVETELQSHDLVRKRDDARFAAEAKSLLASLTSVEAC
ncbi:hypothetical protein E4U24_004821 [Claviceps purpurea]|nr:hypothetical protein E4U24_004821 [Claviceps purpurea]